MGLVNKLQTFKPIYMAVRSGGLSIGGRDPYPISQNQFWKVRTCRRLLEGSDRTADGSGLVGLARWVGFAFIWTALPTMSAIKMFSSLKLCFAMIV